MRGTPELSVLRLGHRPGRDERTTTHVGLTARALGADSVVLVDDAAGRRESIEDITERFGGPFAVRATTDPVAFLNDWDGTVVHLTMYGLPLQDVERAVRERFEAGAPVLVAVGAEKVPFDIYEAADWNVAVTNQPHSEIASLAVFLDRLLEGNELDREWEDASRVVVPKAEGKEVRRE
ncbi:tRNA (cytidine(56)-2'-O)-methyltransferase [Halobacteriales archaeon QH_10_65_19]|jgi:tRNA (cytidine56-2'-O)-methyltransferase|nr:MAG: tRNA (cytidine(56)-2'-O)-methyltransferase [Halobacteriales archaeon QH_10_65_19]